MAGEELVFENVRDPSITPPKPHRSGLPVLSDKRPPLPVGMQPGDPDVVRMLAGDRVTVQRRGEWPGTARSCMHGPRGLEVYVRLDQGSGGWFPLDDVGPARETTVASHFYEMDFS